MAYPIIVVSSIQLNTDKEEKKSFDEGRVTNGYGSASGVYVTVQEGTSANINVDSQWKATSEKQAGFTKSVHNLTTSKFHVTATLTAVGTSSIPATVSAYVEVTKIRFADSKELHVINTRKAVAAQANGSTSGVESTPTTLNVTPV